MANCIIHEIRVTHYRICFTCNQLHLGCAYEHMHGSALFQHPWQGICRRSYQLNCILIRTVFQLFMKHSCVKTAALEWLQIPVSIHMDSLMTSIKGRVILAWACLRVWNLKNDFLLMCFEWFQIAAHNKSYSKMPSQHTFWKTAISS